MRQYDASAMKINAAILTSMLSVCLLAGCIKEDRTACPCRLVLDFSDVDTSVVRSADLLMRSDEGFDYSDRIDVSGFESYMVTVPRSQLSVYAWAGAGHCLGTDMSVTIPYGEECPRVFLHVSQPDADCELVEEKVVLRKNHCVLTVQVEKGEDYPFILTVKGKVNGYGRDFKPSVGDFSCRAFPDTSGLCHVVLPRQLDSSLILEVDDGTESVKTFAIGESVIAGGYDWTAPELDDVTVMLDYSLTEVALEIVEWNSEHIYDVII